MFSSRFSIYSEKVVLDVPEANREFLRHFRVSEKSEKTFPDSSPQGEGGFPIGLGDTKVPVPSGIPAEPARRPASLRYHVIPFHILDRFMSAPHMGLSGKGGSRVGGEPLLPGSIN